MKFLKGICKDILGVLFPPVCHICGTRLTDEESFICNPCISHLPRTHFHRRRMNAVETRLAGIIPFRAAASHFFYSRTSETATLLHDLKYRKFPALGRRIGRLIGEELNGTPFLDGIDLIMPIPLHFMKRAKRGYNQTEELAAGLSEATGIPVTLALRASKPHRTQTSLSMAQRQKNTSGIFSIKNPAELAGRHILIIDDVCTTGSTLISAGETLLAAVPSCTISFYTVACTF